MYNQSTQKFSYQEKKAINALLFVISKVHNLYNIVKVFYFADKDHLEKYGRLIFGESYIKMAAGPVPSNIYDILKFVRGEAKDLNPEFLELIEAKNDNTFYVKKEADLDYLSESDILCLTKAITNYGTSHHSALYRKSHDEAYNNAEMNNEISLESIINTLNNKNELKSYLSNLYS